MAWPHWHALAGMAPAALAWRTAGPAAGLTTLAGAVLIDADRTIDWLAGGGRIDYRSRKIRPLHSWELIAAFSAGGVAIRRHHPSIGCVVAALTAGFASHLLLDQLVYRPMGMEEFLLLGRVKRRFGPQSVWPRKRHPSAAELAAAATIGCLLVAGQRLGA